MSFQMFKLDLEKVEEPEIKLPTSTRSLKKQEEFKKTLYCFIDYAKAFECVNHNKLWKILSNGNTRPPYLPPEEVCMHFKKQQLEPEMKRLVPNWERSMSRLYIVTQLI